MKDLINKIPVKAFLEKVIPGEIRTRIPLLDPIINFSNYIALALGAIILISIVTPSGGSGGGGRAAPTAPANHFSYVMTEAGNGIRITRYSGPGGALTIPARIEGIPVREIADGVFRGNNTITQVVIPNGIQRIEGSAFTGMQNLTRVTLPNSIEFIGYRAFSNNPNLRSINLPANSSLLIWESAFTSLPELNELNIPNNFRARFYYLDDIHDTPMTSERNRVQDGSFSDSTQLPLRTRQRLRDIGYTSVRM